MDRDTSARHIQIDRDIEDRQENETFFLLPRFCPLFRLLGRRREVKIKHGRAERHLAQIENTDRQQAQQPAIERDALGRHREAALRVAESESLQDRRAEPAQRPALE